MRLISSDRLTIDGHLITVLVGIGLVSQILWINTKHMVYMVIEGGWAQHWTL